MVRFVPQGTNYAGVLEKGVVLLIPVYAEI